MRRELLASALLATLAAGAPPVWAEDPGSLGEAEQLAMTDAMQYALEKNPTKQAAEWVNPDTGTSGAVAPLRTFENAQGQPCREFVTTIIIGGKQEQGYGTACRQPDGSWQIVAEDRELPPAAPPPPPPPPTQVYVYPPPPVYYAYPLGFYGPSRIYLSFSYVYRGGWVYRGSRYLGGPEFRRRHPVRVKERVFVGPRVYERYRWRDYRDHERKREYRGERWSNPDRSKGGRKGGRR